jgi:hypothetical protein
MAGMQRTMSFSERWREMNELLGFMVLTWPLFPLSGYLVLSIVVVIWAIKYARNNRKHVKRWGWGAALVMFLIPCWDWIPTVAVHQYYCATESGFWVYKTLDQWKAENPGVLETLVANKGAPSTRQGDMENYTDTYLLNQRINKVVKQNGPLLFNRWRHEQYLVDAKTNEALARYVYFSTSQERQQAGWNGWKFWLSNRNCIDSGKHPQHHFYEYENQLTGILK